MHKNYTNYSWDHGVPRGMGAVEDEKVDNKLIYKVISDPYHKRYSVEKYQGSELLDVVYDSALFDFRWLKPVEQNAWQKETIRETEHEVICLIRNQDERVVLKEQYVFKDGFCHYCKASHPSGQPISLQQMYYTHFGDSFNGVVLFDKLSKPVVFKEYDLDEEFGEFSNLISEMWKPDSEDVIKRITKVQLSS